MKYYLCQNPQGEYYTRGAEGFRPEDVVVEITKEQSSKILTVVDEPVLEGGIPRLDGDGNPVTRKVAVVDETAQTQYETRLEQERLQREQDMLERQARFAEIRESVKKDRLNLLELEDIVKKIVLHLGI